MRQAIVATFVLCCGLAKALHAQDSAEADLLKGAEPSPGKDRANVPVAVRDHTWYLRAPDAHPGPVELYLVDKPESVTDARTGAALPFEYAGDTVRIEKPDGDALIAVTWRSTRWDENMAAFAEQDRAKPPKQGGVLFVGSSTIVGWDLDKSFPELQALNRGFGGSQYSDAVYYADRAILPYKPSTVVLYSGDNDIAAGKSPARVAADFEALLRKLLFHLPEARVLVLSIKPSLARWEVWDKMRAANAKLEAYALNAPGVEYVDIASVLLGPDGTPRPEFFKDDGLHLNERGYEAISDLLRPLLLRKRAGER
jgi:lysophospholipase L1-like esterase